MNRSMSLDELELGLAGSPFFFIPTEITLEVMRHLPVRDLMVSWLVGCGVARAHGGIRIQSTFLVCRMWSVERHNEVLWKSVVNKAFAEFALLKPASMSWRALAMAAANELSEPPSADIEQLLARAPINLPRPGPDAQVVPGPLVQGTYVGYWRRGMANGVGIMMYKGENVYTGQFVDTKRHGVGEFRWRNGNTYIGEWDNDKQTGMGEFKWNDGDYYKGEWKDDHRHGKGMYSWPKGSFYEGEFNMNDLHNFGRYTWKSGYYEGGWKNSARHGKGTIRWTNGNKFEGEFVNNCKSGFGVYCWSDGATYEGTWDADDRSGHAVTSWSNGMSYEGEYRHDLRNGIGKLMWPNGDTYEGVWKNGGRFGTGTFTIIATGETFTQLWNEEEKIQYSKGIPPRYPHEVQ